MQNLISWTVARQFHILLFCQIFIYTPAIAVAENETINAPTTVTSKTLISTSDPKVHIFRGHAKAVQEGVVVDADELKVIYKKAGGVSSIKGSGKVKIKSNSGLTTGDKAELIPTKQKVVVTGNAVSKLDGGDISADTIESFYTNKWESLAKVIAYGDVTLISKTKTVTGNHAVHLPLKNKTVITGNAVALLEDGEIKSSKMSIYYYDSAKGKEMKKLVADGDVTLISKTKTVTGNHAVHLPLKNKTVITGNAVALLEEGKIESSNITIYYHDGDEGKEMKELVADENVTITTNNGIVTGDHAKHFVLTKVTDVMGNAVALDKETRVEAEEIEVFHAKEENKIEKAYAYRNVYITGELREVTGDYAELYPDEKKIIVKGNAIYKKEGEDLKGKIITYFYERDDIIITGGSKNRAKVRIAPGGKGKPNKNR